MRWGTSEAIPHLTPSPPSTQRPPARYSNGRTRNSPRDPLLNSRNSQWRTLIFRRSDAQFESFKNPTKQTPRRSARRSPNSTRPSSARSSPRRRSAASETRSTRPAAVLSGKRARSRTLELPAQDCRLDLGRRRGTRRAGQRVRRGVPPTRGLASRSRANLRACILKSRTAETFSPGREGFWAAPEQD